MESVPNPIARSRRTPPQPLSVIDVPRAIVRMPTLEALSGRSRSTLYRDAKEGRLELLKIGKRFTGATSEAARQYLKRLQTAGEHEPEAA